MENEYKKQHKEYDLRKSAISHHQGRNTNCKEEKHEVEMKYGRFRNVAVRHFTVYPFEKPEDLNVDKE